MTPKVKQEKSMRIFQGVAGMSRDLGRDVPDLEKLYEENFGSPNPRQGPEPRFSGKEGFVVKIKNHCPSSWKREFSAQKIPF